VPAVDTNVLVRLIARDDSRQVRAAEEFISAGAWVSLLALVQTLWVLDSAYGLSAGQIADAVEMLLAHKHLLIQDRNVVSDALAQFREHPRLGFSDCLLVELARNAGQLPLGTFDKDLAKLSGADRL
jgi:predicted nucleic-acid-binding protein